MELIDLMEEYFPHGYKRYHKNGVYVYTDAYEDITITFQTGLSINQEELSYLQHALKVYDRDTKYVALGSHESKITTGNYTVKRTTKDSTFIVSSKNHDNTNTAVFYYSKLNGESWAYTECRVTTEKTNLIKTY